MTTRRITDGVFLCHEGLRGVVPRVAKGARLHQETSVFLYPLIKNGLNVMGIEADPQFHRAAIKRHKETVPR